MTDDTLLTGLAPTREPLDPEWSERTLTAILSADRSPTRRLRGRRPVVLGIAAGLLTLGTATAVAVGGPEEMVKQALDGFVEAPNTTGNGLGELNDPQLVAQFPTDNGLFSMWVATPTSKDGVCFAYADGTWNGEGTPSKDELDYGCGGQIWVGPDVPPTELTRADQLGGFFKDDGGPLVYGVSPYADAASVRVVGAGVDRTLPIRPDSHGYGAALPGADHATAVTLTFLDADGHTLGTKRLVAPIG